MVKTWQSGKGEDFTCPHCGALYEVEIHRLPVRDNDHADCQVCKAVMKEWNSTSVPVYKLKARP